MVAERAAPLRYRTGASRRGQLENHSTRHVLRAASSSLKSQVAQALEEERRGDRKCRDEAPNKARWCGLRCSALRCAGSTERLMSHGQRRLYMYSSHLQFRWRSMRMTVRAAAGQQRLGPTAGSILRHRWQLRCWLTGAPPPLPPGTPRTAPHWPPPAAASQLKGRPHEGSEGERCGARQRQMLR